MLKVDVPTRPFPGAADQYNSGAWSAERACRETGRLDRHVEARTASVLVLLSGTGGAAAWPIRRAVSRRQDEVDDVHCYAAGRDDHA
jgi:hypothetical protein